MTPDDDFGREGRRLLYPFYLDTDISMAFSAALTDGVALEEERVDKTGSASQAVRNLQGNLKLWRAGGFDAGRSGTDSDELTTESRLVRRHTVASIFIDLYDELRRTNQLAEEPDLATAAVGDIVSVRMGPAVAPLRRIIDQLLRLLDLMSPVLDEQSPASSQQASRQQRRAAARDRTKQPEADDDDGRRALDRLRRIATALRDDLEQSGMIDIAVRVEDGTSAVLTLDKRFVSATALELIHTSSFTVVGRVTNAWSTSDEIVNLYRRSVLSLLPALAQSMVWAIFAFLGSAARALDPDAMEALAWASIRPLTEALPDDQDIGAGESQQASVQDAVRGEGPRSSTGALSSRISDGDEADEIADDDVRLGDDVEALNPVVTGPAVQILPLAICS